MSKRIHIVGAPRSGTTLMAELMVGSFQLDGYAPHEMSIFLKPDRPLELFCSKQPRDVLHVRPLLAIDRNLWVIYVLRDPRDVIVSRHGRAPDRYWTNLRVWKLYHRSAGALMQHPRFLVVRYEDLVADPDSVQQRLMAKMPFLKRLHAFSSFHAIARPSDESLKALRGVRPISQDNIGAWRRHKPRLAAQLQLHGPITQDLIELGYEPDDRWLQELAGVEADNQLSEHSEEMTDEARRKMVSRRRRGLVRYLLGLRRGVPVCTPQRT